MEKPDERKPEDVAKDLEEVNVPEIAEGDLDEVFGGVEETRESGNYNCCC
jgi:hypothetical protein